MTGGWRLSSLTWCLSRVRLCCMKTRACLQYLSMLYVLDVYVCSLLLLQEPACSEAGSWRWSKTQPVEGLDCLLGRWVAGKTLYSVASFWFFSDFLVWFRNLNEKWIVCGGHFSVLSCCVYALAGFWGDRIAQLTSCSWSCSSQTLAFVSICHEFHLVGQHSLVDILWVHGFVFSSRVLGMVLESPLAWVASVWLFTDWLQFVFVFFILQPGRRPAVVADSLRLGLG